MVDPTGMMGDYYDSQGRYMGTDDTPDDGLIWFADFVQDNGDGTFDLTNRREGSMLAVYRARNQAAAFDDSIQQLIGGAAAVGNDVINGMEVGTTNFARGVWNTLSNPLGPAGAMAGVPNPLGLDRTEYANPRQAAYGITTEVFFMAATTAATGAASSGATSSSTSVRAFHSGAGSEGRAIAEGFQTLGQTRAGQNLQRLIDRNGIPWSRAEPMWERLSRTWARGVPDGSRVNVFLNKPRSDAIWFRIERPILRQKNVSIIER